jgi:hypothetical protein
MIKMTNVCEYCGEEWWDKHECEGTIRARLRKEAEARATWFDQRKAAALKALEGAENAMKEQAEYEKSEGVHNAVNNFYMSSIIGEAIQEEEKESGIWDNFPSFAPPKVDDPVNSPKHYTSHPSGVECIDITKHYNFQIGNAIKYLWRQGIKTEQGMDSVEKQIQDCEKAMWYIRSYIVDLKGTK